MPFQLVEVHWRDAQLCHSPVSPDHFAKEFVLAPRVTVGHLVLDAPTHVAVASTLDESGEADGVWVIPKTWIESVWLLEANITGVLDR